MIKRSILSLLLLLVSVTLLAKPKVIFGTFVGLMGEQHALVELDYSRTNFGVGLTEAEVVDMEKFHDSWKDDLLGLFCRYSNEETQNRGFLLTTNKQLKDIHYHIVICPQQVDDDGEVKGVICLYKVGGETAVTGRNAQSDTNGSQLVGKVTFHGEGGRIGTRLNLMGDGMKRSGKEFGKFLKGLL